MAAEQAFWEGLASGDELRHRAPRRRIPSFSPRRSRTVPAHSGNPANWQIEWKWDGIRAQLIRRGAACFIWSRGEELITERFPEVTAAAAFLPDGTVLDGELVAWKDGVVQPFALLQQRIGRKKLSAAILADIPVRFLAYDLLEEHHADLRSAPLRERRARLEALLTGAPEVMGLSPLIRAAGGWEDIAVLRASRARAALKVLC
jgi:DNA ligase-1